MSTRRLPSTPCLASSARCTWSLLLTLGWNCTRCTLQSSSPQPWLRLSFGELDWKVNIVQFQLKSVKANFKSASSRCAWLFWLENGLSRTWAKVGEVALPPQWDFTYRPSYNLQQSSSCATFNKITSPLHIKGNSESPNPMGLANCLVCWRALKFK